MRFLEFCKTVASNNNDFTCTNDMNLDNIPKKYIDGINIIINLFEYRDDIIQNMDLPYIEKVFDIKEQSLSDKISDICIREFGSQSIPDAFFNIISDGIFQTSFTNLSNDNKIIIKTLTMYLLLSK